MASGSYDNANIATDALTHVGQKYGQCWTFVRDMIYQASDGTQDISAVAGGGDYFAHLVNAGGTQITSLDDLSKGDVVQKGEYGDHTYIIVGRVSGSTFDVVDANHALNEVVMHYHRKVVLDSNDRAYRFGYVGGSPPSAGSSNLFFVKTRNTGSGHVEVHSATASSGYKPGQHSVTWFSPSDANNGWFQMVGTTLYFIKTKNTGSGKVEIHSATAASGYKSGIHTTTWFSPSDANTGWFQMVGTNLFFVKTRNTGSGHVEVHSATASSDYKPGQHSVTWFSPSDANNGWFQVGNKS
jgi:hypothetical protein